MARLGLALSGGGFRAVLYHLGVVRFLRDAGLLQKVTHITSVSGGSVLGAHLVLNWDRYCGTDEEFQDVADEMLRFLQLDVRNRIVRRFPMTSMANIARRTVRRPPKRQFTRAGLLEQHYEKFLYGDKALFSLPESPRLYMLSTDLSEGSLCAFYRDGMLLQRRVSGEQMRFEQVDIGLGTVPMAVAASSAFPGFFPPLELRNWEVGAREGEFSRHAFTDGGIYDNVGLRMFRHIQESTFRDIDAPELEDVIDQDLFTSMMKSAHEQPQGSPLRRLSEIIAERVPDTSAIDGAVSGEALVGVRLEQLETVILTDELFRDPAFDSVRLSDPAAQLLMSSLRSSTDKPALSDQIWLNRQIIAASLEQAAGKSCLSAGQVGFDGILVSDAGASFKVRADGRAGGLLSTAMRSSDILMDRVNQLELESFRNTPGVVFFPITRIVDSSLDASAPHPEVQRQAALIRTDMDRFSDLEITSLIQHGYCVARCVCREEAPAKVVQCPSGDPWNPLNLKGLASLMSSVTDVPLKDEKGALSAARSLQRSSSRRIVSTLFSFKDWPTYVWVPLFLLVVCTLPYMLYQSRKTATRRGYVLSAVAATSPMYGEILDLLEQGSSRAVAPVTFQEKDTMEPVSIVGFDVLSDDRIFDLRSWLSDDLASENLTVSHSRIRVRRKEEAGENSVLRFQLGSDTEEMRIAIRNQGLEPDYYRASDPEGGYIWEMALDLGHVPLGSDMTLVTDQMLPNDISGQVGNVGRFQFTVMADTGVVRIWVLMPEGRPYEKFEIHGFPIGEPERALIVEPTTTVNLPIGAILTFQLINPQHQWRYECRWQWSDVDI